MTKYKYGNPEAPIVLIQSVGDHDLPGIENEIREIHRLTNQEFAFVAVKDMINIPLIFQLLILEIAIDGLRLAALNTPSMLSTPLSVIAGLVMGEFSVKSGWFNSEVMLYMAFVAVANYTQPNFELGYALKFMRIILICLTAAFGPWGLLAGTALVVVLIVTNRTISGKSYIYPIVPFNAKQFLRRFFRVNLPSSEK